MISTAMMIATPATCHQTEIELNVATRWLPRMLTVAWKAMITRNRKNVPCWKAAASEDAPLNRLKSYNPNTVFRNVAAPKSTDAHTAINPMRLNQPVNQPQPAPPSFAAHQ